MTFKLHHPVDHLTQWNLALGLPFGILIFSTMAWSDLINLSAPNFLIALWAFFYGCLFLALTPIKLYIPLKLTIAAMFPFFICSLFMFCPLWVEDCTPLDAVLMPLWGGFKVMRLYICVPLLIIGYHSAIYWKKRQSYLTES